MTYVQNYATFFENIEKDTPVEDYEIFFEKNATFKDPFHKVTGVKEIYNIFQKMYFNLDKPIFKIEEIISNKNISYIKWQFEYSFKNEKKENSFTGLSRVVFNLEGKVVLHEDFWDAGENVYEKIPILKIIIKFVKNKINS